MSEGTPETPPADAGLGPRVSALETGQSTILGKLDDLLGFVSKTPDAPAEPERPEVDVAAEIRRQLSERDRKAAKDRPAEPAAPKAAELTEKPPVAPVRRLTNWMWGETG